MLKAYKYRIYPTKDQKELIKVIIGACRFVYNWALEQKIKTYEQYKKSISRFDLQRILVHAFIMMEICLQSFPSMRCHVDLNLTTM